MLACDCSWADLQMSLHVHDRRSSGVCEDVRLPATAATEGMAPCGRPPPEIHGERHEAADDRRRLHRVNEPLRTQPPVFSAARRFVKTIIVSVVCARLQVGVTKAHWEHSRLCHSSRFARLGEQSCCVHDGFNCLQPQVL